MERERPDVLGLEALALKQGGYFDRADARQYGVSDHLLQHYRRGERFERIVPGVYRVRAAPRGPDDEYLLAWVWTNYRGAISHESALALYELADVLPSRTHVTVPRPFHRTSAPYIHVHLSPLPEGDVRQYHGVRITTPARSIVDAAASGTDPEQIQRAICQALARGLTTAATLRTAAGRRSNQHRRNIRTLLEDAIADATVRAR